MPKPPLLIALSSSTLTSACGLLLSILSLFSGHLCAAELADPAARNGQRIFNQGQGSAAITVLSGASDIQVPASSMPCARCHGEHGVGRPSGGLPPPVITWPRLTEPGGHRHANGRQHPAFSEDSLARLIRKGVDPAGNRLEPVMPRYLLNQEDMQNLIAYLKQLQWKPDPGVSSGRLQIATLLPRQGPLAGIGKQILDILEAAITLINQSGGIHGRLLKLEVAEYTGDPEADLKHLEALLAGQNFALVAPFLSRIEHQGLALVEAERVPLIGPFVEEAGLELPQGRYSFHLFGDIREQTRALVDFVSQTLPQANAAVMRPVGRSTGIAVQAGKQAPAWEISDNPYDPASVNWPELTRKLRQTRRELVLFCGDGDQLLGFLREAKAHAWFPLVLAFGALAGNAVLEMPREFADRLLLAYRNPPIPSDNEKAKEFFKLRYKSGSPDGYLASQIAAYSAVRLLEEGLNRAGRSATREDLIEALELPQGFSLGSVPKLLYGRGRRSGAQGAHLAMVDLEQGGLRSVSLWVSLDQAQAGSAPATDDEAASFGAYPFQRIE